MAELWQCDKCGDQTNAYDMESPWKMVHIGAVERLLCPDCKEEAERVILDWLGGTQA